MQILLHDGNVQGRLARVKPVLLAIRIVVIVACRLRRIPPGVEVVFVGKVDEVGPASHDLLKQIRQAEEEAVVQRQISDWPWVSSGELAKEIVFQDGITVLEILQLQKLWCFRLISPF